MAIYLKLGDKITGSVTAAGYETWVECGSVQWGVGRGIGSPVGAQANRECSTASVSEVTVSKDLDKSSISLFKNAVGGSDKAALLKIHVLKQDGTKIVPFVEYEFSNALISGYSVSSGGDRPSESLSFNFTKLQIKYVEGDQTAAEANAAVAGFDLATGTPT
jgi:type VI secretion system secreted protein Hcp